MKTYQLYLESGPQHRRTMVHVPELLGCMANGPTTDDALLATPDAIRAYLRFLRNAGEDVDPEADFSIEVAAHVTEGIWLGNGSPSVTYVPDLEPMNEADVEMFARRLHALRRALIDWAATQTPTQLDRPIEKARTARDILRHVSMTPAAYLSAAIGAVSGASRIRTLADRGEIEETAALRQIEQLVIDRVRATTVEERTRIVQRPNEQRTLRKALRRVLEHDWEHLAELSRRPGGPEI